jgi:hypothetical protein
MPSCNGIASDPARSDNAVPTARVEKQRQRELRRDLREAGLNLQQIEDVVALKSIHDERLPDAERFNAGDGVFHKRG